MSPPASATRRIPGHLLHCVDTGSLRFDLLAAGAGMAGAAGGAAAALTAAAIEGQPYDLAVSAGIGGGFVPVAPVGCVVVADSIVAADLGAESPEGFLPADTLGLGPCGYTPPGRLREAVATAAGAVTGTVLTVCTATGTAERAAELAGRHPGAAAEAMEGFGVARAAAAQGVPALEIRGVANVVGLRQRDRWRTPDALAALSNAFAPLPDVLRESLRESVESSES